MPVSQEEFAAEQAHLSETCAILRTIRDETRTSLEKRAEEVLREHKNSMEALTLDFGGAEDGFDGDTNIESYIEIEALNKMIDDFNLQQDRDAERLTSAEVLLKRPYFAKLRVQYKPGEEPRDIYLGVRGITNNHYRHIIVDWRSPIGELYYNQTVGRSTYHTDDGRTIEADLKLRRQYDIKGETLRACFDTDIAIEDSLLLQALSGNRSDKLGDITATIQREQNEIVRHEDVPVLLVDGIAGSGKTSILLQRIAYLLYKLRDTIDWRQVYLITPNPTFQSYIDHVLPSMGEHNPHIVTWHDLMGDLGLGGRKTGSADLAKNLRKVDRSLANFVLDEKDFKDITVNGDVLIPASQSYAIYQKFARFPQGLHRSSLVCDELHGRFKARVAAMCKSEAVQDRLYDLAEEEMVAIFGETLVFTGEEELLALTHKMLEYQFRGVDDAIENGEWLRIDRIGMRMIGTQSLSAEEWLYVKLALIGSANRDARYVFIDEVQDYTEAQLMMISRYFSKAHFLLLGDPNQAVRPGTATFPQIQSVFRAVSKNVEVCRLRTSYRSTPEITALFMGLLSKPVQEDKAGNVSVPEQNTDCADGVSVKSVQPSGTAPVVHVCATPEDYASVLRDTVAAAAAEEAADETGYFVAILAAERESLRRVAPLLDGLPVVELDGKAPLPARGVVLTDVLGAKGLEFDHVVLADASAENYGTDLLSRNRLYTAISRATKRLDIVACGELAKFL